MIDALRSVLRDSARYARWCPVLFLFPALVEVMQHAVEWQTGFYDGMAAMATSGDDAGRMVIGHVKVLALFATAFAMTRFLLTGTPEAAVRADRRTLRLYLPVLAWGLFWLVLVQDVPVLAAALDWPLRPVSWTILALTLTTMFFEPCLAAWKVAAAAGDARIGFARSIRLIRGSYGWSLALALIATLPLMAVHYGLAMAALGRGPVATGLILLLDTVLVSVMGAVMTAANVAIARRMTARHGLTIEVADRPLSLSARSLAA